MRMLMAALRWNRRFIVQMQECRGRALRPGRLHRTALPAVKSGQATPALSLTTELPRISSGSVPGGSRCRRLVAWSLVPKVSFESGDMLADDFGFEAHERVAKEIVFEYSDDPKKPHTLHG
jgi:hypothetical protein